MGRFIPGSPTIIVQHMPGAGGLVAANNAALSMPRDGTAIVTTSRTEPLEPLMGNQNAKFDPREFNWLGTANVEYTTCIAWHTAPVKTVADAAAGRRRLWNGRHFDDLPQGRERARWHQIQSRHRLSGQPGNPARHGARRG